MPIVYGRMLRCIDLADIYNKRSDVEDHLNDTTLFTDGIIQSEWGIDSRMYRHIQSSNVDFVTRKI